MYRIITSIVLGISTVAAAQQPVATEPMPPKLARLPEAIRTLPWKSIDLATVQPLEYSRALMIMNFVLNELAPVRASDADMMSTYLNSQNLGAEFAKTAPPAVATPLSYSDATKVAVAILRGPLATSSYATALSDLSPQGLASYKQLYERTCQRRWSEVAESAQQSRSMRAFIQAKGKMQDFETWAKMESQNRQTKYQIEMQMRRNATQAEQAQREEQRRQEYQAQRERENAQMQQALAVAQAQQEAAQAAGYDATYEAPDYTAGTNWYRDPNDANRYRAQTEQRISAWHGTFGGSAGQ